jgi:hypothetical protein
MAFSNEERAGQKNILKMEAVMVTWGFAGSSDVEYPVSFVCKRNAILLSPSSLGSAQSANRKV